MASGKMYVTVMIHPKSRALIRRLEGLAAFARELQEDFPYREDARQAVRDIEWLLDHVKAEHSEAAQHKKSTPKS